MRDFLRLLALLFGMLVLGPFIAPGSHTAQAVAQWSRKSGEPCSTCHTAIPRINYYGERYLRRGFQNPDENEPDGDTKGKKKHNDNLVVDLLENYFGARISFTPIKAEANALTKNGDKETRWTVGNPDWLQLFVAGSIFKNVAIFIENELQKDAFKFAWFHFMFTDLGGSSKANVQIGNLSPLEFSSYSNRLSVLPAIKGQAFLVKSSLGAGEDSVDLSSARPGVQYYGYAGPAVWFGGLSPGAKATNPNQLWNYWGGLRLEVPESAESTLEGSSFSLHYFGGSDAKDTATAQVKNKFWRVTPALNLRYRDWDVQAAYIYGRDDNITLSATSQDEGKYWGVSAVGAYLNGKWYPALQYDYVKPKDNIGSLSEQEYHVVTPTLTYLARENFRLTAYGRIDLLDTDKSFHPKKLHQFIFNIRTMF